MKHHACKIEWSGLFVCGDCYDPRPVWLDPPVISPREGAPLANARFDVTPVYADDNDPVTGDDL